MSWALMHHLKEAGEFTLQEYWTDYYLLETASMTLRAFGLLLAATYFWRGGPKIVRLFSPAETNSHELPEGTNSETAV